MSDAHVHEHKGHRKTYIIIFFALAALTALELLIAEFGGLSRFSKGSALTLLALGKAFLVAYFYMHLKDETKWLKLMAAVPIMAGLFATVLCLEAFFKPF